MKAKTDFPAASSKDPLGINPAGGKYRVLLVDDSMFIRKQLTQILSSEGFEILGQAENGLEGFQMYREFHPDIDLVTMDITMPNLDGISCLEKILKFDKNARVVMISALGKEELVKKALVTGARNYIIKPLDRKKVLERIAAALK